MICVGGNIRTRICPKVFGQVWRNSGKNLSHPQKFPAPTHMLSQVCTAPILSKSEEILMNLNRKQMSLCQPVNHSTLPQIDKEKSNSKKMTERPLGLTP